MSGKHEKAGSGGILAALAPYNKALTGAILGGVAMWLKVKGHGVDGDELWQILGAIAAGGGLIYGVPNKDPKGEKQRESVQPPEGTPGRVREHLNRKGLT